MQQNVNSEARAIPLSEPDPLKIHAATTFGEVHAKEHRLLSASESGLVNPTTKAITEDIPDLLSKVQGAVTMESGDVGELGDPGPNLAILDQLKEKSDSVATGQEPELADMEKHLQEMEELIKQGLASPYYGKDKDFTDNINGYAQQIQPIRSLIMALSTMDGDPSKHELLAQAFGNTGLMSMNRAQRRAHEKKLRKKKNKR